MRTSSWSQSEVADVLAGKLADSCCGTAMVSSAAAGVSGDREFTTSSQEEAVVRGSPPLPRDQDTGGDGRSLRGGTAGDEGADEEEDAAAAAAETLEEGVGGEEGCGDRPGEASFEPFGCCCDAILPVKSRRRRRPRPRRLSSDE